MPPLPKPRITWLALAATLAFTLILPALVDAKTRRADGHRIQKIFQALKPPWFKHVRPKPTPTPQPPKPEPPEPIPPPLPPLPSPRQTICAVWDTLASPANLSAIAHSHDLRIWLTERGVDWRQLDPALASQVPPPPAWCLAIFDAAAADKLAPPFLYVLGGKTPSAPHQLDALDTLETIQAKIADDLPPLAVSRSNLPRQKGLGLKKRKPQSKLLAPDGRPTPKLSAILRPLKANEYPACDLRTAIPIIDDQGGTSLCTSFAGCLLTEHARFVQFGPSNVRRLSAANIATRIRGWDGASLTDVITAIATEGVCTENVHPENSQRLPTNWQADARHYRWLKWYDAPESDPMGYTAAALARGLPSIIGISVGGNFSPDSAGRISYARGSGRGGHAVVACGHTPAAAPGWTLIANSWGRDWGQAGFAWIEDKFIVETDFDGPYVCTAISAAAADSGPRSPISERPAIPAAIDLPIAPPCPGGICPIPKRLRPRLDRPGASIPSQTPLQ
jgi:hypothetical protein